MEKVDLSNVTLVCVEGNHKQIDNAAIALDISEKGINFHDTLLIAPKNSTVYKKTFHKIPDITWGDYNRFILFELSNYIESDYAILIQTDGFIINPNLWDNKFLEYDFIGAPWDFKKNPHCADGIPQYIKDRGYDKLNTVGNGGFSLRSKRFLEATKNSIFRCDGPEDQYLGNTYYDYFKKHNIRYAPEDVAKRFSRDPLPNFISTFGFHGLKGLINDIKSKHYDC